MTGPGALALTGLVLLFLATVAAVMADSASTSYHSRGSRQLRFRVGLVLLALAASAVVGAVWWEALS